jgi:serine/threonine protein kinase
VLFGLTRFSERVDVWSAGVVLFELAGSSFHHGDSKSSQKQALWLFRTLGSIGAESWLRTLPVYPQEPTRYSKKQWPVSVMRRLGSLGVELGNHMLAWEPEARIVVEAARKHEFFHPGRFDLVGGSSLAGCRRRWNL